MEKRKRTREEVHRTGHIQQQQKGKRITGYRDHKTTEKWQKKDRN